MNTLNGLPSLADAGGRPRSAQDQQVPPAASWPMGDGRTQTGAFICSAVTKAATDNPSRPATPDRFPDDGGPSAWRSDLRSGRRIHGVNVARSCLHPSERHADSRRDRLDPETRADVSNDHGELLGIQLAYAGGAVSGPRERDHLIPVPCVETPAAVCRGRTMAARKEQHRATRALRPRDIHGSRGRRDHTHVHHHPQRLTSPLTRAVSFA